MATTMALMPIHSEWLEMLIKPALLNREYLASKNERNIFDLMVHLINNGLDLTVGAMAAAAAAANGQPITEGKDDQDYKQFVETKKLKTIHFLVFKLLAYFNFDMDKIVETIPSKQQEFLFNEFRATFEHTEWKIFANIMFNRWVQRLLLKQAYPSKQSRVIQFANNVSQNVIDPYFVAPETHEIVMKRVHGYVQATVPEVEKLLTDLEHDQRPFQVMVPAFDCFWVDDKTGEIVYDFEKSLRPERNSFLDDIYYDFGKWYFIKEDYEQAYKMLSKIKTSKSTYDCLEGYKTASRLMLDDHYVVPEPKQTDTKESLEKKIVRYINTLVKDNANFYDEDYCQFDPCKVATILKKLSDETRRSSNAFIYDRVIKYFLAKISFGNESVRTQCREIFFGKEIETRQDEMEGVIEEGEIGEHDQDDGDDLLQPLEGEDANEIALLHATYPDSIVAMIPKIKRPPLVVNRNWTLPPIQANLLFSGMAQLERVHFLLAKANELRRAKYYQESRQLYVLVLEETDPIKQNQRAKQIMLNEILQTDLLTFFDMPANERSTRFKELEERCAVYLNTIEQFDKIYLQSTQLLELVCVFTLDYLPKKLLDMKKPPSEIVQFSICLANTSEARERSKEFWEYLLFAFVVASKQPQMKTIPRITFFSSLANFLKRITNNTRMMMYIATALVKVFNLINDNPTHVITTCSTYDMYPVSIPSTIVSSMDRKEVSWTLEEVLKAYLGESIPQNVHLMKYYGDFLYLANAPSDAMRWYVSILARNTLFFSNWDSFELFEEMVVDQMIKCAGALGYHLLVAVLYQFKKDPDYGQAFKSLNQVNGGDGCDDLLECLWDITMLEYLINLCYRRALAERAAKAKQLMQQLDINSNNSEPVLKEAAALRKGRLMRILARLYMQ